MKIAIMQPYFYPYQGYFQLFAETDLFVVYDCVQFIKRGWIHRNKFTNIHGELEWLTLMIKKQSQKTKIKDIEFYDAALQVWQKHIPRFPLLHTALAKNDALNRVLTDFDRPFVDYLIQNLQFVCQHMGLHFNIIRSSTLGLSDKLKGQDRILAIIKAFSGTEYFNLPGGQSLYDEKIFAENDIKLSFLETAHYPKNSMLETLLSE